MVQEMPADPAIARYRQGDLIFGEGAAGDRMYIIQAGRVRIVKQVQGEDVELAVLGRDDFFGEMALLSERGRAASAHALEDCELLMIDQETFYRGLRNSPKWVEGVFKGMSERIRRMNDRIGRDLIYRPASAVDPGSGEETDS